MSTATEKPSSIRRAAVCLWASALLALVLTVPQVLWFVAPADVTATIVIGIGTAALLALIAAKISAGRGWARWLYAFVYVFGTLAGVVLMLVMPDAFRIYPPMVLAGTAVQFVLQTTAIALIFTGASRAWFRGQRAELPALLQQRQTAFIVELRAASDV